MKSTITLHLEPHCEKYVRFYFENENDRKCKFSRELKQLILICCEPHASGVVKCPDGLNELLVEHPSQPQDTRRHDMRGALHIPDEKMSLINSFISSMIEREINMQYSYDRAYKMNQRARRGYASA
jgi:hypothetical protein